MPAPSRAPLAGCPTPGSAAALESRLLKAYRRRLFDIDQPGMDALVLEVLGPLRRVYDQRQHAKREERLDEELPELLMLLSPKEQRKVAPLLLEQDDLAGFARAVLAYNGKGNDLYRREPEPRLDDSKLFKAAGLGRLARRDTGSATAADKAYAAQPSRPRLGPPLVLLPPVLSPPRLRTARRRHRLPHAAPGQLSFHWPPVAAGQVLAAGL